VWFVLGVCRDDLREHLKDTQRKIMAQKQVVSSDSSSSSSSSSSESESESSSSSSEEDKRWVLTQLWNSLD